MVDENSTFVIDHVELPVDDRYEAAEWFRETLGFTVNEDLESWTDAGGPLLVSADDGSTHLALVPGAAGSRDGASPGHVALRIPGSEFLKLIDDLTEREVTARSGSVVSRDDIIDRNLAFAVMIQDPWGNHFELISYDYETIKSEF